MCKRRLPDPICDLSCELFVGPLCCLLIALVLFTLQDIDDGRAVAAAEDGIHHGQGAADPEGAAEKVTAEKTDGKDFHGGACSIRAYSSRLGY